MNKFGKTLALAILATVTGGAAALALDVTTRGPLPFTAFDTNNDGAITEAEFNDVRAKRQAARAAEGRPMRNAASAPPFTAFDTDKDGKLTQAEFAKGQSLYIRRGMGMGPDRGMGMGRRMMNQQQN